MKKNLLHLFVTVSSAVLFMPVSYADDEQVYAANIPTIETVMVQGYRVNLLGETLSASEGIIGSADIANRPVLRTGEILEFVPGMVVTQHSGSGKANQYFLRGFNLDHGTDFNTSIDGMPVNMRTHGHGQGYTDLNFIIPEFIDKIAYQKGSYYAEIGDFSGAGAAEFSLKNQFNNNEFEITGGENNYGRALAAGSIALTTGTLLLAVEKQIYDGPWTDINEAVDKKNAIARYVSNIADGDFSATIMAYDNHWNSADQIPERAVQQKIIDNLGSLDTSVGGLSSRYSLSSNWHNEQWFASAYAIRSSLDLFSDFTYFLDDPVNGDQFEQVDERSIYGGELTHHWNSDIAGKNITYETGAEFRDDDIGKVGLYHTRERERLSTTRQDKVNEASLGLFGKINVALTDNVSANIGARYDYYRVNVDSNITQNSGMATQGKLSVKAGITYRVNDYMETYANIGQGFHSNDARGVTITQDPITAEPSKSVDLLVPSNGAELGVKIFNAEHFNVSTSLWYLRSASELVFVGDAGNTEASRASERYGTEIASYYWLSDDWNMDAQLAWTRARFTENINEEGKYVDGSVPFVASAGISYGSQTKGFHAALRYRYFGARQLDTFDIEHAQPTSTLNIGAGYAWQTVNITLDLLNVLSSDDHDIDYFYTSRLKGEPAEGIDDLHYHPVEPRTVRVKAAFLF